MFLSALCRPVGADSKRKAIFVAGKDRITTSQMLTRIRQSGDFTEAVSVHDEIEQPSFGNYLYELMEKRRLTARDMIDRTGIHRSYFYAVLAGQKIPSKNVVLRISLTMRCTLAETNQLLRLAGLSHLYPRVREDTVLIYAVEHWVTPQETNEMLEKAGEEPLYR